MPVVHHSASLSRVDPALRSASHVFLRVDAVKRPLVPPYEGPFPVLCRSDKTFDLLRKDKTITVSIDRLKPAHFLPDTIPDPRPVASVPAPVSVPVPPAVDTPVFTASGRASRPVNRYQA